MTNLDPGKLRRKFSKHLIHVKREDVEKGIPLDDERCMYARAINREVPFLKNAKVGFISTRATDKVTGDRYVWETPSTVQASILAFDAELIKAGLKPMPTAFKFHQPLKVVPYRKRAPRVVIEKDWGPRSSPSPMIIGGRLPKTSARRILHEQIIELARLKSASSPIAA